MRAGRLLEIFTRKEVDPFGDEKERMRFLKLSAHTIAIKAGQRVIEKNGLEADPAKKILVAPTGSCRWRVTFDTTDGEQKEILTPMNDLFPKQEKEVIQLYLEMCVTEDFINDLEAVARTLRWGPSEKSEAVALQIVSMKETLDQFDRLEGRDKIEEVIEAETGARALPFLSGEG